MTASDSFLTSRRRSPDCVSDLRLDQLATGELDAKAAEAVKAHVTACAACGEAWHAIDADRTRFASEVDVATFAARVHSRGSERPRGFRRLGPWLWAPLGVSAALAAALFVARPHTERTAEIRIKGAPLTLATYVKWKDDDRPGTLHLGEPLRPGDKIQFRISTSRPGHLAIIGVDDAGEVSVYHPTGESTTPVAAGQDQALPTAVELDATLGNESVIGILCEAPTSTAKVTTAAKQAVEQARAAGRSASALGALDLPCAEARTTLRKVSAGTPP